MATLWTSAASGGLIVLLNIIGIIGLFIGAPDFSTGWERVQETYSPWNVWNWGLNMVLISPAILVYWLRDRRRKRREKG